MLNKHYDNWMDLTLDSEVTMVKECEEGFWHAFADTVFYAEGGGMPSDTGMIENQRVLALKNEDGIVWHLLKEELKGHVHMEVDKAQRIEKCQIHSASHLVCGIMNKIYHAPTISFFTQEHDAGAEMGFDHFDESIMKELEELSNRYIREDLTIDIVYPTMEEAKRYAPDEKLDHDELRAAVIGDIDYNMCGCIHTPSLRYIQTIKFLRYEKTTRGYRIYFVCGNQLLQTYGKQNQILLDTAKSLGVNQFDMKQGITKLQGEVKSEKAEVSAWKQKYIEVMSEKIAASSSHEYISWFFNDIDIKTFQTLCSYFVRTYVKGILFVCHDNDCCHVVVSRHKELDFECNTLFKDIADKFELRGGGNKAMAQGGGTYKEDLYPYIETLTNDLNC